MKRVVLFSLLLLAAAARPALCEAELVLRDGTVLRGTEVRREAELYVIELESGERVSLPAELVEEVRLSGEREESAPPPGERDDRPERPDARVSADDGPSGLRQGEPQTLAGIGVRPPRPAEQTRALGPAARFQRDIVRARWTPKSDWDMNPARNDFNPSTWPRSPVDTGWRPRSAFDADTDVLESGRSRWQRNIVDSGWQPRNAFAGRAAF